MKDTYQEIIIDWRKKEAVKTIDDFILVADKIKNSKVLYKIYGDHHVYGRDVLLYIGISTNIKSRFDTHLKGVFQFVNNKSVSLGVINDNFNGKLEIPESILIANHKPAFNKEYIHSVDQSAMEFKTIVINNGNNGMLKTCCTNYWWVN